MILIEEQRDLFEVNSDLPENEEPYCLAHCISADFGMFGGIVVGFNERWNMKNVLLQVNGNQTKYFNQYGPFVIPVTVMDHDHETTVYNLVTKPTVGDKPTYNNLDTALKYMSYNMKAMGYKKLAIPTLGCGIDGLDWDSVKDMICGIFRPTDIEIRVCRITY